METHSSILSRRILWTEEPGGLQSIGLQRDTTQQLSTRAWKQEISASVPVARAQTPPLDPNPCGVSEHRSPITPP